MIYVEKPATLNLRVNPRLKPDAETILSSPSIPMSIADIDATEMTEAQLHAKLQRGYDDYKAGKTQNAEEAFAKFREIHL